MKRSFVALCLTAGLCLPAFSKAPMLIPGQVAHENVTHLNSEITWNRSLPAAEDEARREGKMVFWVHMLGSMSGAT